MDEDRAEREVGLAPPQRMAAIVRHHREWLVAQALVGGGEVRRERGATWVLARDAEYHSIAFPRLQRAPAGEQIDRILDYYRGREPRKLVICWSAEPTRPRDLGARLMARGFDFCWQMNWMWLELDNLREEPAGPPDLRVGLVESEADWDLDDLPHYSHEMAAARFAASKARPRRVWHFGAWVEEQPVGHCTLFVTAGRLGIAGIWGCGVVPHARNQGIGRAVTLAACRFAREIGCRAAMLNATGMGEPVYRRLGFEPIGAGAAWWLDPETLAAPPPAAQQIALAEAAARGDALGLEALASAVDRETLDARLPSTATLIELAARARQPSAAACLERFGATLDLMSAWDLGWKERVPELLAARPELAAHGWGRGQHAPLHLAADRGDLELARLLLDGGADTEVADGGGGTPLHYAAWRGHAEITRMLLARGARLEPIHTDVGTPLTSAIRGLASGAGPGADHLEVIARLLDVGACPDGPGPAYRPLHLAVRLKLLPVARLLRERGARADLADAEGKTAAPIGSEVDPAAAGPGKP